MFDLYNQVFKKANKANPVFDRIETCRKILLQDKTMLTVTDLGAGSLLNKSNQRSVASITKNTSKPKKYNRFLAALIKYLNHRVIIELGTSMGIATAYMAGVDTHVNVTSIEGCPSIHKQALKNIHALGLDNVNVLCGAFDDVLPEVLKKQSFDLLYVDGNHTYEATMRYFNLAKELAHNNSVIVFDDIYWSEGMTKAWDEIKQDKKITASIDLFEFGIVFFKTELSKQDFVLRY